jgi:hypothetical protein
VAYKQCAPSASVEAGRAGRRRRPLHGKKKNPQRSRRRPTYSSDGEVVAERPPGPAPCSSCSGGGEKQWGRPQQQPRHTHTHTAYTAAQNHADRRHRRCGSRSSRATVTPRTPRRTRISCSAATRQCLRQPLRALLRLGHHALAHRQRRVLLGPPACCWPGATRAVLEGPRAPRRALFVPWPARPRLAPRARLPRRLPPRPPASAPPPARARAPQPAARPLRFVCMVIDIVCVTHQPTTTLHTRANLWQGARLHRRGGVRARRLRLSATPGSPRVPGTRQANHGTALDQPGSVGVQPRRVLYMPGPGATAMGGAVELVYPDFIYFNEKHPK